MKRKNIKMMFSFVTVFLMVSFVFVFSAGAVDADDIVSISVKKFTLIQNYDGKIVSEEGKADYFRYNTENPSSVTVRFRNGKTLTDTFEAVENYFGEDAVFSDSQSSENPWSLGVYKVSYNFMGYTGEFDTEIIETPVERITVKDEGLIFRGDGYYDGKTFYYHSAPAEMTVYYKDGTVKRGTADSFYEVTGYPVNVYDDQTKDPWGIGRHKCRLNFMGVDAFYFVEIKESPVKSILVDEMNLYEGIDGYYGRELGSKYDSSAFYYNAKPEKITVFYKDGTAFTGSVEEVEKATGYEVIYDTEKKWEPGKQTAQVSFVGATTKFIVNVKENPVVNVSLSKKPNKTSYYAGELFDFKGTKIKVSYINGKSEEVDLVQNYENGVVDCYLATIGKVVPINSIVEINRNASELSFDFADRFFNIPISVKSESFSSIELSTDGNDFPLLTFKFDNASKKTTSVYNAVYGNYTTLAVPMFNIDLIPSRIPYFSVTRISAFKLTSMSSSF